MNRGLGVPNQTVTTAFYFMLRKHSSFFMNSNEKTKMENVSCETFIHKKSCHRLIWVTRPLFTEI